MKDYTDEMYEEDKGIVLRMHPEVPVKIVEDGYGFPAFVVGWCILIAAIIFLIASCQPAHAEVYDSEEIAQAIWIIEGGDKAKKPYGILSVPCKTKEECRMVCLETIHNNFARWQLAGAEGDFLSYLAQRYAPPSAHPLNKNWLPNLRYYLTRSK